MVVLKAARCNFGATVQHFMGKHYGLRYNAMRKRRLAIMLVVENKHEKNAKVVAEEEKNISQHRLEEQPTQFRSQSVCVCSWKRERSTESLPRRMNVWVERLT